ncbi:MAG: CvpA family protein [Acetatifactor sp.]|nr:CvpA family protein [Acetatifactor sp.]
MNIMLIVAAVWALFKLVDGYKKGMVKEIISLVTLIIMGIMVVLISRGLHSYMEKEIVGVGIAVVLLALLGIVHHLLGVVFFSAKMITKLPVVHWLNKVLGAVFGILEVILTLQIVYVFIMYFGLGMIGQQILEYTRESAVLTKIYQFNVVAKLVENLMGMLPALSL